MVFLYRPNRFWYVNFTYKLYSLYHPDNHSYNINHPFPYSNNVKTSLLTWKYNCTSWVHLSVHSQKGEIGKGSDRCLMTCKTYYTYLQLRSVHRITGANHLCLGWKSNGVCYMIAACLHICMHPLNLCIPTVSICVPVLL